MKGLGLKIPHYNYAMFSRARWWDLSVFILIYSGLIAIFSRTIAELDLWGHLNWGNVILDRQQVTRVDPFSYLTAGYPWTNHEWLGDVIFAVIWNEMGSPGLLLLKLAVWLLSISLILIWLIKNGLPPLRAGLLVFLGAILLNGYAISVRPQIFTILGYTLVLLILLKVDDRRYGWLWALPPLFAVWANLHGAWLAGLGLLAIWSAVYLLTHRSRAVWLRVLPPLLLTGLATLLTPFRFELWQFLISHLSERRLEIVEWRPMEMHTPIGWAYLVWLTLVILAMIFSRRPRSLSWLVLIAVTAYLPWIAKRHMMYFALTALLIVGPHIGDAWERWMPVKPARTHRPAWALLLPWFASVLLLTIFQPNLASLPFPDAKDYPVAAMALLRQSKVKANLANHFNWGNYISWHLAPEIKVAVDTRREMAYPAEKYRSNMSFLTGRGDWAKLLEEYPTDLVLIDPGSPTENLVRLHPDWQEIYRDGASVLYARRDSLQASELKATLDHFIPPELPKSFP